MQYHWYILHDHNTGLFHAMAAHPEKDATVHNHHAIRLNHIACRQIHFSTLPIHLSGFTDHFATLSNRTEAIHSLTASRKWVQTWTITQIVAGTGVESQQVNALPFRFSSNRQ